MHSPLPPFTAWDGPHSPKLVICGEAWGETEARYRRPFVGASGRELFQILLDAGYGPETGAELAHWMQPQFGEAWINKRQEFLDETGIGLTNVLALHPPNNKLEQLCLPKPELPKGYSWPALSRSAYLHPDYLGEVDRLGEELIRASPNLLVLAGNTACWAELRASNIGQIRGTISQGTHCKSLPTYHPAGVLRQWSWRPIVVADFIKAKREAGFPEIRRPRRQVLVNPTIEECEAWVETVLSGDPSVQLVFQNGLYDLQYLLRLGFQPGRVHNSSQIFITLACDIETGAGQIKCVGFAKSVSDAIVIPFVDFTNPGGSYWSDSWLERRAWECVRSLLEAGKLAEDTMLLHHSLYPEMQKGLGFLGSIYTSEPAWKLMRRERPDSEKRDE